jgi:simple sugar transport system permease protein
MSQTLQTTPPPASTPPPAEASNRVKLGWSNRLLARPDVGALFAAIVILIFFLAVAPAFRSADSFFTVLYQASTYGIVAVGVGMLMIGGEFDLSAGVAVFSAGLLNSMFCYNLGINLWVGAGLALVFALGIGFLNGYLVMRTGIPSFLITLGTFFVLQGANLGITKLVTGSVSSQDISQMDGYNSLGSVFAGSFKIGGVTIWGTVLWWLGFVAISAYVLTRTKIGNWIYAVGGNAASARAVGVPVTKVKIGLFMTVSFLGWFDGMHYLYRFNTLQANNGVGDEFIFIIAAVVGGTLLTGGFGNAIGVAIGAFIFGMTSLCIVYAGWDPNWFKAFLGVMLLLAVGVNLYIKKLSTARKVG